MHSNAWSWFPAAEPMPVGSDEGQVYVISGGDTQKIGRSRDPERRVCEMQTGHHASLTLLQVWPRPNGDASRVEKMAHRALRQHRARGEWFLVPPEQAIKAVVDAAAESDAMDPPPPSFPLWLGLSREAMVRMSADRTLPGSAHRLFFKLVAGLEGNNWIKPSQTEIARGLGLPASAVSRAMRFLRESGIVERVEAPTGGVAYRIPESVVRFVSESKKNEDLRLNGKARHPPSKFNAAAPKL